ncbi:murein hydrolase activator EnvC [Aurantimonas sp. HBX-1]|uniref:murein hydrolase activator EnvC family protein n=1 Tax=Aurantimonas sp. HBX-1 TaxID=2906072 RepID=UPI001F352ADB|nr:peptidoglycan DD-metalloendopeptidase family protein [Aurantimonas sp. HBX-1]UIJ72194.1 peptidoglycan DD-metalloendopeptidase family protein [Aurantimonas sp. HBX-1]
MARQWVAGRRGRWRRNGVALLALVGVLLAPLPGRALPEAGDAAARPAAGVDPIRVGALEPSRSAVLAQERRKTAENLAAVSRRIALSEETIRSLDSEIAALSEDREKIRAAMTEAAEAQKRASRQLDATEGRIDALAVQEATIKASLRERRGVLAEVLGALERMGRKPPPALLVKPQDALGSVRSAILLGAVVPAIRGETEILIADLQELAEVRVSIAAETARFAGELTRYKEEETRLAKLSAEKQRLEAQNRDRRAAEAARAAELASEATDLEGLIASLESDLERVRAAEEAARVAELERREAERQAELQRREAARLEAQRLAAEAEATRLAALEAERRAAEAEATRLAAMQDAAQQRAAEAAPPAEPPVADSLVADVPAAPPAEAPDAVAEVPEPAVADAAEEVQVAALEPSDLPSAGSTPAYDIASIRRDLARLEPAAAFSTMKGRLSLPVAGKLLIGFGDRDDIGRETTGASFGARPGDVVTSPADARVLYSGPFRSYGQLLILDAGDGYHVVLAGMDRIDVESGQFVSAGEPVASMGAKRLASVAVAEFGASEPALYVEFRKDGKPVDPSPWWMDEPSGRTKNDS